MGSSAQHTLIISWRERASYLEQFGDPSTGRLWKLAAVELERSLQDVADETVSLAEAATISGYTIDHLGALIRRGKLANAGRPGAPRIRRADLPTKNPQGRGRPARRRSDLHIRR